MALCLFLSLPSRKIFFQTTATTIPCLRRGWIKRQATLCSSSKTKPLVGRPFFSVNADTRWSRSYERCVIANRTEGCAMLRTHSTDASLENILFSTFLALGKSSIVRSRLKSQFHYTVPSRSPSPSLVAAFIVLPWFMTSRSFAFHHPQLLSTWILRAVHRTGENCSLFTFRLTELGELKASSRVKLPKRSKTIGNKIIWLKNK